MEIEIGDKVTYTPFLCDGLVLSLSNNNGHNSFNLLLDGANRISNVSKDSLILISKAKKGAHQSTNEITCPHCDHEFINSWESGIGGCEEEMECESCDETFMVMGSVTYSSYKKDDKDINSNIINLGV